MQKEVTNRLTSLEVLGIGLSIDSFDLQTVAKQINQNPFTPILPADLPVQVEPEQERLAASEKGCAGALASAVKKFVNHWSIPAVTVWPSRIQNGAEKSQRSQEREQAFFLNRLDTLGKIEGGCNKTFSPVGIVFADEPDDILERAFQFFDHNPAIPALLLYANDGVMPREVSGNSSYVPYRRDRPRRIDSLADSAGAILLTRRSAVDNMRQYLGSRATHIYAAGPAKPGFAPSRFVPQLWTHEQIDHFDRLPALATLHRPIRVGFCMDKEGEVAFDSNKQVSSMNHRQRQDSFTSGFRTALQLMEGLIPSRIFHDAGPYGVSQNDVLLGSAIFDCLPDFDIGNPQFSFDIFSRIGNLGATSPFAQWILALTASGANKDISMTVNLRQQDEATITIVSPSNLNEKAVNN